MFLPSSLASKKRAQSEMGLVRQQWIRMETVFLHCLAVPNIPDAADGQFIRLGWQMFFLRRGHRLAALSIPDDFLSPVHCFSFPSQPLGLPLLTTSVFDPPRKVSFN